MPQPPHGVCADYHNPLRRRGLTRHAPERPSLACLTSGGERVERKMDASLSLMCDTVIVVALPPTGFPSLPYWHACPATMRLAEPPQLTRLDGLVVCRYGHPDATPPPPCERLEHGAASPLFPSP